MSAKINLFVMAFRNLARHRVKTVITTIAVSVGVALYIFIDAWLLGMNIDSRRNIVNYETGSVKIYKKAFFEKKDELPMYETFTDYAKMVEILNAHGWNAAPRMLFGGSLISPEQELPFSFIGVDTERERSVLHYDRYITEGRFPEKGQFEILIGVRGAKNLKVTVGDRVRLTTVIDKMDEAGKIHHINQLIELVVCGIVNSPNPKTNGSVGYLPLDILNNEMGLLLEGGISEIVIRKQGVNEAMLPDKHENKDAVTALLDGELSNDLIVIDWIEDVEDFIAAYQGDNVSTRIMTVILFILAFLGIANTMLMAVLERTKEIGMLRSMGMTDWSVVRLFFYEAGFIGLIGSLIGIAIGILINIYMVNYGIDYTQILDKFGTDYGYRIVGHFKAAWNWGTIAASGGIGTLAAAITAIPPALRAVRMSIVESLRFE